MALQTAQMTFTNAQKWLMIQHKKFKGEAISINIIQSLDGNWVAFDRGFKSASS